MALRCADRTWRWAGRDWACCARASRGRTSEDALRAQKTGLGGECRTRPWTPPAGRGPCGQPGPHPVPSPGHQAGVLHQAGCHQLQAGLQPRHMGPSVEVPRYRQAWVGRGWELWAPLPQKLLPVGLPENLSVIAWDLNLDHPTVVKFGTNSVRELVSLQVRPQSPAPPDAEPGSR